MIQWHELEPCVKRCHSCKLLRGGRINLLFKSWQREAAPSPVLTVTSGSRSKHANMRSFYFGPAFEMFALRVTLLPQSCRSAQILFPLRCSLLLSLSALVFLAACLLLLPTLLPSLSFNVGQWCCSAVSIKLQYGQFHCGQTLTVFIMWINSEKGLLITG